MSEKIKRSMRVIFIKLKGYLKQTTLILIKYQFQKKDPMEKKFHLMELHSSILLLIKSFIMLVLYV